MEETQRVVSIVTKFDIEATNKPEAIKQLVNELTRKNFISDAELFMKDVFAREDELPTYIGHHIGLPHSQSPYVKHAVVAVGKLKQPIIWNETHQANLIFLIAAPNVADSNLHLKILANLSRMLIHDDFREKLRTLNETDVKDMMYAHMTDN